MIYKAQHRKLKNEKHERNTEIAEGAPDGWTWIWAIH